MIRSPIAKVVALVGLCAAQGAASAAQERLGVVSFPAAGVPAAREQFIRGVLLLHSFEYEDAARAFRRAQEIDPDFAMAYWGEAMTHNHPVWNRQDRDAARAVLARLGPTREARLARAPPERERMYLEAVEILYADGPKPRRDTLYAEAMARLSERYPDDPEARAFYALALLGLNQGERDYWSYMRAAAAAEEVFAANPEHPGAAHYLIHSYDDPVHGPLGLRAARAYAGIAPDAAHAQHMTSHIFVAMGMWDEVVAANEQAMAVVERKQGRGPVGCGHYNEWLEYGYLQQGRYRDAWRLVHECRAEVARSPGRAGSLLDMWAMHLVDAPEGNGTATISVDSAQLSAWTRATLDFTDGWRAVRGGDLASAARAVERLAARERALPQRDLGKGEVMERVLRATVLWRRGSADDALAELNRAAALEESLPYEFGPPAAYKPPRELKGEILLGRGRPAAALAEFELALRRTPQRAPTLLGLARAAARTGATATAVRAYRELAVIRRHGDPGLPELAEAERYLARHGARAGSREE